MKKASQADHFLSFIRSGIQTESGQRQVARFVPSLTISRQDGCGVAEVTRELERLLEGDGGPSPGNWTVIDKELVDMVLKEHALPEQVKRFMPESHVSAVDSMIQEILGLHPSSRDLLKFTKDTIRRLALSGRAILVGRAGNIVTENLENVFHVRLIAPEAWRVRRVMERDGLDEKAARQRMNELDRGRASYVKSHFRADINNPDLYDMVLNISRLSPSTVAHLIAQAMCHWMDLLKDD